MALPSIKLKQSSLVQTITTASPAQDIRFLRLCHVACHLVVVIQLHREREGEETELVAVAVAVSYTKPSPFLGRFSSHFLSLSLSRSLFLSLDVTVVTAQIKPYFVTGQNAVSGYGISGKYRNDFVSTSNGLEDLDRSQCRQITGTSAQMPRISALFWGSKRSVAQQEVDLSLGDFTLTGSFPKEILANEVKPKKISHSVVASILDVSPSEWDACGFDATGPEKFNTLLTHGFSQA